VNKVLILQLATGAVLAVTLVMGSSLLWSSRPSLQTASIGLPDGGSSPEPSRSPSAQRPPKIESTSAVISLSTGTDADSFRYFDDQGRAFSVQPRTGEISVLSDKTVPGFIQGWWLPGVTQFVGQFQKGTGAEYRWSDYVDGQSSVFGGVITSFATSPDGRSAAFIAVDGDHPAVYVSGIDGSGQHVILQTRTTEDALSWPKADLLALVSRRPDQTGWDLTSVSMTGGLTFLLSNQENLELAWSHDGSKLLYSSFVPKVGVQLFSMDVATGTAFPLGLATSASKCAWSSDSIRVVCGVPTQPALTSDVPASKTATVDSIVAVDFASGTSQTLWTPPSGTLLGVIDPVISSSGRFFAFSNIFDHRLYVLDTAQ